MHSNDCTPYPWLVRIIHCNEDGAMFAVFEHTNPVIAVDREFWPDDYDPPVDKDGYYLLDKYAGVMPNRVGVARMIVSTPAMYELLKETLEWLDDKFPPEKYPLDIDNHYRNRCDIAVARRRESIRSIIAKAEGQNVDEECYA